MPFPPKSAPSDSFSIGKSGVGEELFADDAPKKSKAPAPAKKKEADPYETMDPLNESEDDEGEGEGQEKHTLKEVLNQVASGGMEVDFALSEIKEITGYDGE